MEFVSRSRNIFLRSLFAVDYADYSFNRRPSLFNYPGRLEDLPARGGDVLHEQHADLCRSLSELLEDIFSGRKRLKVYRQFKMYNDPTMNPYLYRAGQKPTAT